MLIWFRNNPAFIALIGALLFTGGVFLDVYSGKNNYVATLLIVGVTLFSPAISRIWTASKLYEKQQRFQFIIVILCGAVVFISSLFAGRLLLTAWLTGDLRIAVRGGGEFAVNYYENAKKFGFYFTVYTVLAPPGFVIGLFMMLKPRFFSQRIGKQ
ncbi:hypothetical protein [Paenochrobactrum glaciei]|uniref:Uncharacterized protein n=1 Tax=Paenochrobactrum glaciei TaxID=486407 RepID=A0ABN1GM34_9HYPH